MSKYSQNITTKKIAPVTPAAGKNIGKLLLLFALITFGIMLVSSIFIVAPRVEETLTQQKISAAETTIRIHAESIRQYFFDRSILLRDITRFPAVITSTMTLNSDSIALKELLFNTSILGQHLPLALLDIEGEIIYTTDQQLFSKHNSHIWTKQLISGESDFYLELFTDDTGDHFEIAVPVIFRGNAEGILVTIIPSEASNILKGKLDDASFYVELKQGDTIFTSQNNPPSVSVLTREQRLEDLNLDLTYIIDKTPILHDAATFRNQLLIILSIVILTAFIVFLMLGYRILVLPYKTLSDVSNKLRDTSKELQLIFDHVPARIWYKDAHNKILRLNTQAAESMGMTVADAEGKDTYDLFPDMAKKYHDDDLSVINSGQARLGIIEEYTPLDGRHGWVSTDKVPYTDPNTGEQSVLVVAKDITDLKATQSALAESEERYKIAVRGSSVGIWGYNIVEDILYWSPLHLEILGINAEDFIPHASQFFDIIHPEDIEYVKEAYNNHLKNGHEYNVEYRQRHKNGHYIWLHSRGQAVWDKNGKAVRMAGSTADISARKSHEEVLTETKMALSKTVDQLTKSNDELSRFAYVASHDLQEPIRMVGNFTELLKRNYNDRLDERGQQYLDICNDSAKHMQALVADLLDYARTDSEADTYSYVDMNESLKYTLDHLHEAIKESNAKVHAANLPNVYFNPSRLMRLLQNLIGNAIKYRQDDTAPVIDIRHEEKEHEWLVSISDNGIGMKQEYLKKIFEPFKRLHHKDQYGGTGIGLAICEKIITQRGGEIRVESKPGQGSTFWFTIPKHVH